MPATMRLDGGSGQSSTYGVPQLANTQRAGLLNPIRSAAVAPAQPLTAPVNNTPVSTSGGGGGAAAAAPVAPPRPNLTDYINNNFLKTQAESEAQRRLQEYDAATQQQTTAGQADEATKLGLLQQNLDDQGIANAEDMAGRGLLRSGLTFQGQDKINQQGQIAQNNIHQVLANLLQGRSQGRVQQEAQGRQGINDAINQITQQYNTQYGA